MALVSYGAMFLVYAWGGLLMKTGQGLEAARTKQGPTLSVAVAQGNLVIPERVRPEDVVRSAKVYDRLSRLDGAARLIVWPETALPTTFPNDMVRWQLAQQTAARERAFLVTGACEFEGTRLYNSAFVFGPDGACRGSYRKQDLVIFGEYVPLRKQLKFLRRYPLRSKDFTPGEARRVFPVDQWRIAPLICYEGIFPEPTAEAARLGADIIVLITSDLWALGTAEPAANSIAAPFRAIEARRYLVRAASNGLTGVYDPYGKAVAQVGYMQEGVARAQIPPVEPCLSTYHRYGNAPLVVLCVFFVVLGLAAPRPRCEV
jgi:apolipoprotein N-acyltransferase